MSNVPASKRNPSAGPIYLTHFYKIYDGMIFYLLRDFGVKENINASYVKVNGIKFSKEDAEVLRELVSKYGLSYYSSYPYWVIDEFRRTVYNTMNEILHEITIANSVYPNSIYEYNIRRDHINNAIAGCEFILQLFNRIITILPVNVEKFVGMTNWITDEISYLREWKKKGNKIYHKLIDNENKSATT